MIEETLILKSFHQNGNSDNDNDEEDEENEEQDCQNDKVKDEKHNKNGFLNGYRYEDRKRAKREKLNKLFRISNNNNNCNKNQIVTKSEEAMEALNKQIEKEFIRFEGI
jgi:ABC-type Zn2+ transport system substrate-binding protein/surface adhesin